MASQEPQPTDRACPGHRTNTDQRRAQNSEIWTPTPERLAKGAAVPIRRSGPGWGWGQS
jgi:hypothetical protein